MYIPSEAHEVIPVAPGEVSHAGHCWCNRTMAEVGPDDRQVGSQKCCDSSRSCFEE
jgi:hypothetical protein